jgi:hypothetical protein
MIESVREADIQLHVLWRSTPEINIKQKNVIQYYSPDLSLSQARNYLVREVIQRGVIQSDDIVCFSDDDGLWTDSLEHKLKQEFSKGKKWLLGCYIDPEKGRDRLRFPAHEIFEINTSDILKIASSLGIFIRGDVFLESGPFDESLGVGAEIPSGEDVEYALRLLSLFGSTSYIGELYQFHPYKARDEKKAVTISLSLIAYLAGIYPNVQTHALQAYKPMLRGNRIGVLIAARPISCYLMGKFRKSKSTW